MSAAPKTKPASPEKQLAAFFAKYTPEIQREAKVARATLRKLMPWAHELAYDNWNGLAIGYAPTEKTSEVLISLALYPRWMALFFMLDGARLPDPEKLLRGAGPKIRQVRLMDASVLDTKPVRALIEAAIKLAEPKPAPGQKGRLIIKSISAKQRPRRP